MRNLILLSIVFLFIACKKENKGIHLQGVKTISEHAVNSECVFVSKGNEENLFLTWTEEREGENILVFKEYSETGFHQKITVHPTLGLQSHHESMAKMAITKLGIMYCVFRIASPTKYNKYGGALFYTYSKDHGNSWSEKVKLVQDKSSSSQSFYDLALLENGELGLIWLDNRFSSKEKRGSTLFFTSTKEFGFQPEKPIAFQTCQCCRTDIEVMDGEIKIAFRNIIKGGIRDMFYATSSDNGNSFTDSQRISIDKWEIDGCPHTGPSIAASHNETGVVWFTAGQGNKGLFFTKRGKGSERFDKRVEISENGNHPQMLSVYGTYYIVYDEYSFKDNTTFQQIKLLIKSSIGIDKVFDITPEGSMNTHPVIEQIDEDKVLISWTNLDGTKKKIQSMVVAL